MGSSHIAQGDQLGVLCPPRDREGGREMQGGGGYGDICICIVIHFVIQEKLTQHCKAIILQ